MFYLLSVKYFKMLKPYKEKEIKGWSIYQSSDQTRIFIRNIPPTIGNSAVSFYVLMVFYLMSTLEHY
jgi:hypothetical protein